MNNEEQEGRGREGSRGWEGNVAPFIVVIQRNRSFRTREREREGEKTSPGSNGVGDNGVVYRQCGNSRHISRSRCSKKKTKKIHAHWTYFLKHFLLLLLWFSASVSPLLGINWHIKSELMWCFYCQVTHSDTCNLHGAPQWYYGQPIILWATPSRMQTHTAATQDHFIVPHSIPTDRVAHWTQRRVCGAVWQATKRQKHQHKDVESALNPN